MTTRCSNEVETRLIVLVCNSQGPFALCLGLIVEMSAVKAPAQQAVMELTNYKTAYQSSDFIRFNVFGNAGEDDKFLSGLAT